MPRHTPDATTIDSALELLTENGFEGLSRALELLLNEAMRLERSEYLGAGPYERTGARRGYANGNVLWSEVADLDRGAGGSYREVLRMQGGRLALCGETIYDSDSGEIELNAGLVTILEPTLMYQ